MGTCISSHSYTNSGSSVAKVDQIMSFDNNNSMPPTPVKYLNDKDKPINTITNTINNNNVDPPFASFHSKSRISPFNSISSYRSLGGSKDETFFDTQGWLDSDCDDDFYSVNGDFTPSRGSTPVHAAGTPRFNRVFSPQVSRAVFEGKPPLRSVSNRSRGSPSVRRSFSSTSTAQTNGATSEVVVCPNNVSSSTTKSKKLIDLFRESMRERDGGGLTPFSLPPKPASRAPSSLRNSVSSSDKAIPVDDNVPVKEKPDKFTHRCFPRLGSVRSFSEHKKTSNLSPSTDDVKF